MKKILLTLITLACIFPLAARKGNTVPSRRPYPGGHYCIYRLTLLNKEGTAYSLRHPERFLSEKALERRRRQGLALDSTDLPLSQTYIDAVKATGTEVIGGSKWNNTLLVKADTTGLSDQVRQLPFITKVTKVFTAPDSIDPMRPAEVRTEPLTKKNNPYGWGRHQIAMLGGEKLHAAGFRGRGMTIAIIDGGFMNANIIPSLKNVTILGQGDCVYPYTANVYDLLDHGTMVLSTMAANLDSIFVGTAPEAAYYLLRSEDGRTESLVEEDWWAQAAEAADSLGADVINSSLGYTAFDDKATSHQYREQDGHTTLISRTASILASKGIVLVNSAGNEGNKPWKRINTPGDAENILTVGALTPDSINANFSSVGPAIDGRVKPDVCAMGVRSAVIDGEGTLTHANGTSFASPITCGMVACLWQALPQLSAKELEALVRRSADRYAFPDNVYGYGIPNFWRAYQMGMSTTADGFSTADPNPNAQ